MVTEKLTGIFLFSAVLLSGFYAGIGFFVALGGNPAIKKMSDRTFAEYWQHTDHFMAARMQFFGPLMMVSHLLAVIALLGEPALLPFSCMLAALCILVADLIFVFTINHPLNKLVQSWNTSSLPADVAHVKSRIVKAFGVRTVFMISSFIMVLLAISLRYAPHH